MALYCLPTEPYIDKQFPNNRKWVVITKDYPKPTPEKGKKRVSKDKLDEYNKIITARTKMFNQLETGHYNCFNRVVEGQDIITYASRVIGDSSCLYYRIKPTSCNITSERYSSYNRYTLSEFDVVNKCDTTEKLLLQLESDCLLNDFLAEGFGTGCCINRQEDYEKILEFCKRSVKEYTFCVGEIVMKDRHSYEKTPRFRTDCDYIQKYAQKLVSEGLLLLHSWSDYYEKQTFNFLIRMHWFDLALDYINTMEEDKFNPLREVVIEDNCFKDIERILKTNNDKESVKEITKMLNYKPSILTLRVFPYECKWDDDYEEVEDPTDVKEFENIDDVRAYLMAEYKVPFSKLTGDISDFEYRSDEYDTTHFIVD